MQHYSIGRVSENIKTIVKVKKISIRVAAFFKYMSITETEIFHKRNDMIRQVKSLIEINTGIVKNNKNSEVIVADSKTCLNRLMFEEDECALLYNVLFNTMSKLSVHEFMKCLKDVLGIDIFIEGAKLLLDRINYKVNLF